MIGAPMNGFDLSRTKRGGVVRVRYSNASLTAAAASLNGSDWNTTRPPQSLHRAILDVRIGVVGEHLLGDLGLELAVGTLRYLHQIEVLDRIVVGVELEVA